MQGWRISMEDAHVSLLKFGPPSTDTDADTKQHPDRLSFFGVFDGHGGDKVALFAGERMADIIYKQDSFASGDYAQGLKDGFLATDRAILNGMTFQHTTFFLQSITLIRLRGNITIAPSTTGDEAD
jgi:protein phosphatase 2C family protein 2/3